MKLFFPKLADIMKHPPLWLGPGMNVGSNGTKELF